MAMIYSDPNTASLALFGRPSARLKERMEDSLNRASKMLRNQNVVERARKKLKSFVSGAIFRKVESIRSRFNSNERTDNFRTLRSASQMVIAPSKMRRFIMANPTYRKIYHDGRGEGYGELYRDRQHGSIGIKHHEYNIINDGVAVCEDASKPTTYVIRNYAHGQEEQDTVMYRDQIAVLRTWRNMDRLLDEDLMDPCSTFGGTIG